MAYVVPRDARITPDIERLRYQVIATMDEKARPELVDSQEEEEAGGEEDELQTREVDAAWLRRSMNRNSF